MIYRCGDFAYRFDPSFVKWPSGLGMPQVCGLYVYDGELYAANRSHEYPIAVFDLEGNFKRGFGAELHFARSHGLYVTERGELFVCDDPHQVIYCMDAKSGKLLRTIGEYDKPCDNGYDGTIPWPHDLYTIKRAGEPFNHPTRLVQAPNGDYYVTDGYANVAIHRFDRDFKLKQTFGAPGDGCGTFRLPHSLWVDGQNRVWVADREGYKVQVFTEDGRFLEQFDHLMSPSEPWSDGKYMYVIEDFGRLSIFSMEPKLVAQIGYRGSPLNGHSLCGDKQGNLYVGHIHGQCTLTKLTRLENADSRK